MKHQLIENIGRNDMPPPVAIRYTCSCGSFIRDLTLTAFFTARGVRTWCVPRSAQKAFREHIRQAAIAARPATNDISGLTATTIGDDYDSLAKTASASQPSSAPSTTE
jgi:hypothetical protein